MTKKKKITKKYIEKQIAKDMGTRMGLASKSLYWFFVIYLPQYIKHPTAVFQMEMFNTAQDKTIKSVVITAFRGSGKSTIMSTTYPIWAMVTGQKKFIIILSQNQTQSKRILAIIRHELESNRQLISDFGPFRQVSDEWSQHSLLVNKYGTRIACMSSEEAIRGTRHLQHRPDLIICDDVEDINSTRTKEARDKTFNWLTGEVIPSGDTDTKIVIIGNKLHEDGLMMRLKDAIEAGFEAKYMEYPLLDENRDCLWLEKYPNSDAIDKLKSSVPSETSWLREYLLKIVPEDDAVIQREWIKYYDECPDDLELRYIATGIDLAISEKATADYTAMVSGGNYGYEDKQKIYILPHPINKRMEFPKTIIKAMELSKELGNGQATKLFIEEVGYQGAVIQELVRRGYPAEGVKPNGQDKRARLSFTAPLIKNGTVLFPRKGCEELIGQLVGFGSEKHDDLADAFAILVLELRGDSKEPFRIHRVPNPFDRGVEF